MINLMTEINSVMSMMALLTVKYIVSMMALAWRR
jgi:hypothetical protein